MPASSPLCWRRLRPLKEAHLKGKIAVYMDMALDLEEIRRTCTSWIVEAAMQQDARDLGITLTRIPLAPGGESRH